MATTKEDLSKLKVGDTVWLVGRGLSRDTGPVPMHEGRVTKTGRKYLSVAKVDSNGNETWDGGQFYIETGAEKMENSYYARNLYIDIHAYVREQERLKAWDHVCTYFRNHYRRPEAEVSTENIREAAKLLGIELKE